MIHLNEGESIEVQGSGKKPYVVKNSGGNIHCSCPAWKNQSLPIDQRICKHIKANVSNGAAASVQSGSVVNGTAPKATTTPKNVPPCLLAHPWDGASNIHDWYASYKLDGVRAWWDGERFWSRLGNEYHAPQWFKDQMPRGVVLDGEVFAGNKLFHKTVSFVKKFTPVDHEWKQLRFVVFDMPKHGGVFEERYGAIRALLPTIWQSNEKDASPITTLDQTKVTQSLIKTLLAEAEQQGYEGLMLRQPGSLYEAGRSHTLLKVKSFVDCEVTVTGYKKGKGEHSERVGSLDVVMDNGVTCNVGTGLSDRERENPPPIGSRVTISYQELSPAGVPRFPAYVGTRNYE